MQRLTFSEFLIIIALLITLAWCAGQLYQAWLVNLTDRAIEQISVVR